MPPSTRVAARAPASASMAPRRRRALAANYARVAARSAVPQASIRGREHVAVDFDCASRAGCAVEVDGEVARPRRCSRREFDAATRSRRLRITRSTSLAACRVAACVAHCDAVLAPSCATACASTSPSTSAAADGPPPQMLGEDTGSRHDPIPPHRQPRRDRLPHHPHRARARHPHRRGLFRRRRRARSTSARPTRRCTSAPSPARESYLVGERIIAAARRQRRRGDPPRLRLPVARTPISRRAVIDAGLVWVGPNPDSIRAMGLKDAAKAADDRRRRAGHARLSRRGPVARAPRRRRPTRSAIPCSSRRSPAAAARACAGSTTPPTSPTRSPRASARRRRRSATTAC